MYVGREAGKKGETYLWKNKRRSLAPPHLWPLQREQARNPCWDCVLLNLGTPGCPEGWKEGGREGVVGQCPPTTREEERKKGREGGRAQTCCKSCAVFNPSK